MPIPSEVPTSFVPHAPLPQSKRSAHFDSSAALAIVSMIVLVLTLLAALGVFLYGNYLGRQLSSRQSDLHTIQQSLNQTTVATYSHTSQQITSASVLLSQHVTFSQFFNLLEAKVVQNIRFKSLSLIIQKNYTAKFEADGAALNFDALVAESQVLLNDNNLSDVAFSSIEPSDNNTGNTINFSVSAIVHKSVAANFATLVSSVVTSASTTQSVAATSTATTTTP